MKINEEFAYFDGLGEPLIIPLGKEADRLQKIATLSIAGGLLFQMLKQGDYNQEEIVEYLMQRCEVDADTAWKDVGDFLNELVQYGVIA